MKSFEDMTAMSSADIVLEIRKAEHEYVGVRMAIIAGQEKDTSKKKNLRQHIARLKTALRQKELGISSAI